ncbi:MAG: hypothetical protein K0R39_469 [Symbiobacteriaceae bacterium]|jgi:hypothetical protein|nr:hypothetical protein [Symbiobacteriaceae bacterium]
MAYDEVDEIANTTGYDGSAAGLQQRQAALVSRYGDGTATASAGTAQHTVISSGWGTLSSAGSDGSGGTLASTGSTQGDMIGQTM